MEVAALIAPQLRGVPSFYLLGCRISLDLLLFRTGSQLHLLLLALLLARLLDVVGDWVERVA
jgi:hypothetical protein